MKKIMISNIKGVGIIASYQEPLLPLIKNPLDKFHKLSDYVNIDKEYVMNGLTDEQEITDLIKNHFNDIMTVTKVDSNLINILLQKSFKGMPLFVIDLIDRLLDAKLIQCIANQVQPTPELEEMNKYNDWRSFNLPISYEKLLGQIVDTQTERDIIILKYASVIGNIFDIETLNKILPFNNISFDDLYYLLEKFEV